MVYTGTYEHSIDAKHRLAIPADLRACLRERSEAREGDAVFVYVTLGEGQSLSIYAEQDFQQRSRDLYDSQLDVETLLRFERLMFSLSKRVELDKQGRIRIPDHLLERVGLKGDVVVIGNNDHMEIHDRDTWNRFLTQSLEEESHLIMNFRRAMRPRGDGGGQATGSN